MANVIPLVQGDTRPDLIVTLSDKQGGSAPINIAGTTLKMYFRELDADEVTDILEGVILDGAQGLCKFSWNTDTLDVAGTFEGEIEIFFPDGRNQTVRDRLYFDVSEQIK